MSEEEISINYYMASAAFGAKRYHDAIKYMKEEIRNNPRISREQRDFLAQCYKRVVAPLRTALKLYNAQIDENARRGLYDQNKKLELVQKSLLNQFTKACNDFIELIDISLVGVSPDVHAVVFYSKIKGDYNRYLAEFASTENLETAIGRSKANYEQAMKSASNELKMSEPLYLGLVLNFAVFQYEILGKKDEAIDRADASFNEAVRYLDELDENEYTEATMILQLLRDNIAAWREERSDEGDSPAVRV